MLQKFHLATSGAPTPCLVGTAIPVIVDIPTQLQNCEDPLVYSRRVQRNKVSKSAKMAPLLMSIKYHAPSINNIVLPVPQMKVWCKRKASTLYEIRLVTV